MEAAAAVAAVIGMVAERLDAEGLDEHDAGITEASVAELMRCFELEIKLAAGANSLPLPLPLPPTTVVGERRESCGPSLSVPAATVMASVHGRAGAPLVVPPALAQPWPWTWGPVRRPAAVEEEDVVVDDEDEWVSQFLTDGPPPVEGQQQHGGQ